MTSAGPIAARLVSRVLTAAPEQSRAGWEDRFLSPQGHRGFFIGTTGLAPVSWAAESLRLCASVVKIMQTTLQNDAERRPSIDCVRCMNLWHWYAWNFTFFLMPMKGISYDKGNVVRTDRFLARGTGRPLIEIPRLTANARRNIVLSPSSTFIPFIALQKKLGRAQSEPGTFSSKHFRRVSGSGCQSVHFRHGRACPGHRNRHMAAVEDWTKYPWKSTSNRDVAACCAPGIVPLRMAATSRAMTNGGRLSSHRENALTRHHDVVVSGRPRP